MPPPKFPPLPGYTIEGIHGETIGWQMVIAGSVTLGFAIIAVGLRMLVKVTITKSTNLEDYFAVFALILAIVRQIIDILLVQDHQFGQHIWDTAIPNFNYIYVLGKAAGIVHYGAILFAKFSMLLLYIRLFGVGVRFRYICYGLMVLVGGYCTSLILANIFQCSPIRAGWNFFLPGHCASLIKINITMGAFNIVTDLAILVAPIPLILGLNLRRAKMMGVLAIMATGIFVLAIAIVRQVELVNAPDTYDDTWAEAQRELWLSVELNVGIICTCLPLLWPLARKFPGQEYFKNQYHSMVSLIRGTRSTSQKSQTFQPEAESADYIVLVESKSKAKAVAETVQQDWRNTESPV